MANAKWATTKRDPAVMSGVIVLPAAKDEKASPHKVKTTELLKSFQKKSIKKLPNGLKSEFSHRPESLKPGDIIFFDGQNSGSAIIMAGNEKRSGDPGAGRFTHVSIVVDVDESTGQVLIAEAGGAGIPKLRQATIRHLQTGQVFRPEENEFRKHIIRMAVNSTKYYTEDRLRALKARLKSLKQNPPKSESELLAYESHITGLECEIKEVSAEKNKNWGEKDYDASHDAPYAIAGMLVSPISSSINKRLARLSTTEARYEARHKPGFKKRAAERESSYQAWCSRWVKDILVMSKAEQLKEKMPGKTFRERIEASVKLLFGKDENSIRLYFVSPKTLWTRIKNSSAFKYIGDWISFDEGNYHYNGCQKDSVGARPFLNNNFTFKAYIDACKTLKVKHAIEETPAAKEKMLKILSETIPEEKIKIQEKSYKALRQSLYYSVLQEARESFKEYLVSKRKLPYKVWGRLKSVVLSEKQNVADANSQKLKRNMAKKICKSTALILQHINENGLMVEKEIKELLDLDSEYANKIRSEHTVLKKKLETLKNKLEIAKDIYLPESKLVLPDEGPKEEKISEKLEKREIKRIFRPR